MSTPTNPPQWAIEAAKELRLGHPHYCATIIAKHAPAQRQLEGDARELVEKLNSNLQTILSYLGNGGLFNPEFMEHEKVRDMVLTMRGNITAAISLIESLAADKARLLDFAKRIAAQRPERPDYWSSCGQCASNAEDAGFAIDAAKEDKP